jgi:hypothetical protein
MTEALTLDAIVDDAAILSYEHQIHLADLADQLGEHSWQVDLDAGTLTLAGQRNLQTTVQLLGSASADSGTWLWGWANPSGFSPRVTEASARIAAFGRHRGVRELADQEIPLGPDTAARLTDAAKVITGSWTSYSGEAGPGTRVYFLVASAELTLPPPSTPRCLRAVAESLGSGLIRDHRRALGSYARFRGLTVSGGLDGRSGRMILPDGEVSVAFDRRGRISDLSGQAAAS